MELAVNLGLSPRGPLPLVRFCLLMVPYSPKTALLARDQVLICKHELLYISHVNHNTVLFENKLKSK